MKTALKLMVAAVAVVTAVPAFAQPAPEIAFDAVADFLWLPSYGEVAGVATNAAGHVFVYARTGTPVATLGHERTFYHYGSKLFQFDQTGKFVKEIGNGTYALNFASAVRVDPSGNIWAVDAGSNLIMKFAPDGSFLQVLGRKPETIGVRPGPGVPARLIDGPGMPPVAGAGGGGPTGPPGAGFPGQAFERPSDIAFDGAGNAVMVDVHDRPGEALCDGPQALLPEQFQSLRAQLGRLAEVMAVTLQPSAASRAAKQAAAT